MKTEKLTIRLPKSDLQFIEQFAAEHNSTVTELVRRYLSNLLKQIDGDISPKLQKITGILPDNISSQVARKEYHEHLLDKHL